MHRIGRAVLKINLQRTEADHDANTITAPSNDMSSWLFLNSAARTC